MLETIFDLNFISLGNQIFCHIAIVIVTPCILLQVVHASQENEKNSIRDLVTSAVLDSSVKGGLRWPLEKASSGDRYSVIGVWHTISSTYRNSLMRLKVRHAERFNLRSSQEEVSEEITLKLNGMTSELHVSSFVPC